MSGVYRLFIKRYSQIVGIASSFLLLFLLALRLAGIAGVLNRDDAVIGFALALLFGIFAPVTFIGMSRSWLTLLPMRKRALLGFAISFSASALLVALLGWAYVIGALSLVELHNLSLLTNHQLPSVNPHVGLWSLMSAGSSFLLVLWTSGFSNTKFYSQPGPAIGRPGARWSAHYWKRDLARIFAIGFGIFVVRRYFFSGFGFFVAALLWFFFYLLLLAKNLGVFGKTRKGWALCAGLLLFVQIAFISKLAWSQLHGADYDRQLEAKLFLGGWAGYSWLDPKGPNEPLRTHLGFRESIQNVKSPEVLFNRIGSYDPSTLDVDDIRSLFKEQGPGELPWKVNLFLLRTSLSPDNVISFLNSEEASSIYFGLYYARYHRDARYVPEILKNIERYSDELKISGLRTLSILAGKNEGIDFYADWKTTHRGGPAFRSFDCPSLRHQPLTALQKTAEGALNICLHEGVDLSDWKAVAAIEAVPWITVPVRDPGLIERLFKQH